MEDIDTFHISKEGLFISPLSYRYVPRTRMWMAIITPDARKPVGFDREFFKSMGYTNVPMFEIPETRDLTGEVVECGADSYTKTGKRKINRYYGVVVQHGLNAVSIIFRRYNTAAEAFKATKKTGNMAEEIRRLTLERKRVISRLAEINAELETKTGRFAQIEILAGKNVHTNTGTGNNPNRFRFDEILGGGTM